MAKTIADAHEEIMRALQSVRIPAGVPFRVTMWAAQLLNEGQLLALDLLQDAKVQVIDVQQDLLKIKGDLERATPPEIGDAEITIAGVPRVGVTAAEAVASLLKGLAAVGAAVAVVSFTTDPKAIGDATGKTAQEVGEAVGNTAIKAGIPLILILLLLLFLLKEWNK